MKNLSFLLLFLLTACSDLGQNTFEVRKAQTADQIKIPLDSVSSFDTKYIKLIEWMDESALGFVNRADNSLRFYALEDGRQLFRREFFNAKSPEGLYQIAGFDVISTDSILVVGLYGSGLKLINGNGEILKDFNLLGPGNELFEARGRRNVSTTSPIDILSDKRLLINGFPDYDLRDPFAYFENTVGMLIDLKAETFDYLPVRWPKSFKGNLWNFNYTMQNMDGTNWVLYNFSSSDSLYRYDLKNNSIRKFSASSALVASPKPLKKNQNPGEHTLMGPFYTSVLYNQESGYIYRICYHGHEDSTSEPDYDNAVYSAVIINPDLEIESEVVFPASKYNFRTVVPYKKGILLSVHNKFNQEYDEDTFEMEYIPLEKD
jgi:hypothetical protein